MVKLKAFLNYMARFKWVIDLTRWLLSTGGTIAESAFLLATTYVIINLVAHKLMLWMVFGSINTIDTANQIAMIAFSVLPELIVISAIKKSYEMWRLSFQTGKSEFFIWSVLFTLPTAVFVCITIYTIWQFTSLESVGQVFIMDANSLHLRVVSGWIYGVSQMLYAEMGNGTLDKIVTDLKYQIQTTSSTLANRDTAIVSLQNTIVVLQSDMASLENDIVTLRIANAQKKVASRKNTSTPQQSDASQEKNSTASTESTTTLTEKRKLLKEYMKQAVVSGEKVNIKKISAAAGVSYGTGRKHADTLLREITDEHPAVTLAKEA